MSQEFYCKMSRLSWQRISAQRNIFAGQASAMTELGKATQELSIRIKLLQDSIHQMPCHLQTTDQVRIISRKIGDKERTSNITRRTKMDP